MSGTAAHPMTGMDAFAPVQIADLVRTRGVAKAGAGAITTFVLGVIAGAFIALGGVLATTVATGSDLGYGPSRWLAGIAFSLGLIMVVVGGAELFTGNNLVVMAVASRQVTVARLLRNWGIVYAGNLVGAVSVALMVTFAEWWALDDGRVGEAAVTIAVTKSSLSFGVVFWRGILANALVCMAVWLATGGRTVVDKVIAIVPPVAAFVAMGFEHSVANMYFLSAGAFVAGAADTQGPSWMGSLTNLVASTLGNVVGGAVLVGLVYWFVYLRPEREEA
jgi:formate/nitrite transporter